MALNEILAKTAEQFIDIALGVVGILIVYYIYRLFTVGAAPSDDTELEGRREAAGRWLRERKEKAKNQKEINDRKRLLEPAKGFLVRAEQTLEKFCTEDFSERTARAVREARDHAESVERNLRSAARVIRAARTHAKAGQRDELTGFYESCEATRQHLLNRVLHNFPDHSDAAGWDTDVGTVRNNAQEIIGYIGQLINAIDEFIDNDQLADPGIHRPSGGPVPSPGAP